MRIYMSMAADPLTWTFGADMSIARFAPGCAQYNGLVYVTGGGNMGSYLNTSEIYDPQTNLWHSISATMTTPREQHGCCASFDGKIYVAGGQTTAGAVTNSLEVYDPIANTWTTLSSMPTARESLTLVCALDGTLYALGGIDGGGTYLDVVEQYYPLTDSWTTVSSIGHLVGGAFVSFPRAVHASSLDAYGDIYVIGGVTTGTVNTAEVTVYCPLNDTWRSVPSMPIAINGLAAASVLNPNVIFVVGGADTLGAEQNSTFVYTVDSPGWIQSTNINTARYGLAMASDNNGNMYIMGGQSVAGLEATLEYSNPQFTKYLRMDSAKYGISETWPNYDVMKMPQTTTNPMDTAGFTIRFLKYPMPTYMLERTETLIIEETIPAQCWGPTLGSPNYQDIYGTPNNFDNNYSWQQYRVQFGGYLSHVKSHNKSLNYGAYPIYDVELQDYRAALGSNTPINTYYENVFDGQIIEDVLANRGVLPLGSIKIGDIRNDNYIQSVVYSQTMPLDVINAQVTNSYNWRFVVDQYKWASYRDHSFDAPVAAFSTQPDDITTHRMYELELDVDLTKLTRSALVIGGTGKAPNQETLSSTIPTQTYFTRFPPYPETAEIATIDEAWQGFTRLNTQRADVAAALASNGSIYAIGGWNGTGYTGANERYDPSRSDWFAIPPATMPTARSALVVVATNDGDVHAIGGYNGGSLDTHEVYSPTTDSWTTKASLPAARYSFGGCLGPDGNIYVVGGLSAGGFTHATNTLYRYNMDGTNTWTTLTNLPVSIQGHAVVLGPDNRIYAIGGILNDVGGTVQDAVYAYDIGEQTWATVGTLTTARCNLTALLAADGGIYALGGSSVNDGTSSPLNTTEKYNLGTKTWEATSMFARARQRHASALGNNGALYLIGGFNNLIPTVYQINGAMWDVEQTPDTVWSRRTIGTSVQDGYDVIVDQATRSWTFRVIPDVGQKVRLTYTYDVSIIRDVTTQPSAGLYWNTKISDTNIADPVSAGDRAYAEVSTYQHGAQQITILTPNRRNVQAGDTIEIYDHIDGIRGFFNVLEINLVALGADPLTNPDTTPGGEGYNKWAWEIKAGTFQPMTEHILASILIQSQQTTTTDPGPDELTQDCAFTIFVVIGGVDDGLTPLGVPVPYGPIPDPNWLETGYPAGAHTRWGERAWTNEP